MKSGKLQMQLRSCIPLYLDNCKCFVNFIKNIFAYNCTFYFHNIKYMQSKLKVQKQMKLLNLVMICSQGWIYQQAE